MKLWKKIVIALIVVLLLAALGIYFGGAYYFSRHFLPGSRINGMDCSFLTVEEIQERIADEIATYTLTIHEMDNVDEKLEIGRAHV